MLWQTFQVERDRSSTLSPLSSRSKRLEDRLVGMASSEFELKSGQHVSIQGQDDEFAGPDSTYADQQDMRRLGKKQELRRNFRFTSILGFVAVAMGTWEVTLSATAAGLTNGGTGGMIWMFVGSFVCFGTIVLSLAEMSSMAPTAGGQYHWASEFSPMRYQKFISYIAGWMSTLSWQCGTCSGMFLLGTQIQGLIAITHEDYSPQQWQGYLFVILMVSLGLLLNTWGAKQLPLVEGLILVLHIFGFATVLIVLWILSAKNSAYQVFTTFENSGGWSSIGLSMLVGQVTSIYGLIGSDGAAHMAEETKDASIIVPRCMIWSYLLNVSMGFAMLVTYCFCLTDVEAALDSVSGFPYIYVFQSGTGSTGGAVGLTTVIIVLGLAGATSFFASTSRQTFAFARDKGLPGYNWIGAVNPKLMIPLNAILVTYGFTILLSLINLGSTIALQLLALMSTYAISIGAIALKRLRGEPLPHSRWSLGRFGLPINCFAFLYSCFAMIWVCFPVSTPVAPDSMNYAIVMFTGVFIIALIYYFVQGRHVYQGPVVYVQRRQSVGTF
ncbi:hypothetical protein AC579_7030 [Pseudocercospora musae]|uniref:Amino acid permease/ SLC12A domain-containing protein n=1 Tax=Pseudocercospora musae TaxID=113226 RepID=A0A139IA90_9PEZI|nr:hypothetical protein AC579_7030 [Pseudocercospora musae]